MAQGTAPLTDIWRNNKLVHVRAGGNFARATITRADTTTCATRIKHDGTVETVAANVLRTEWVDLDGDGVRETPGLLLEGSRTNTLLQSQALATTWTSNLLTATNNVAAAPDGTTTATGLVPTAVSSNQHRVIQAVTITADENVAFSMYLKANGYNAIKIQVVDTATNVIGYVINFDASTGLLGTTSVSGGGAIYTTSVTALPGGWYRFSLGGKLGGAVTAVTVFAQVFDTIANANASTAFTGDGVKGVLAWGAQLERASAFASSYIKTTSATATRAADSLTLGFNFGPMDLTTLCRFARPVWADASGNIGTFNGFWGLGATGAGTPLLRCNADNTARQIYSQVFTGVVDSLATSAIPAGASLSLCSQFRLLTTGGRAKADIGSGFGSEGSAATAFSAFNAQTLSVGKIPNGGELYGVLLDLLICRGLLTMQRMLQIAGRD